MASAAKISGSGDRENIMARCESTGAAYHRLAAATAKAAAYQLAASSAAASAAAAAAGVASAASLRWQLSA